MFAVAAHGKIGFEQPESKPSDVFTPPEPGTGVGAGVGGMGGNVGGSGVGEAVGVPGGTVGGGVGAVGDGVPGMGHATRPNSGAAVKQPQQSRVTQSLSTVHASNCSGPQPSVQKPVVVLHVDITVSQ